MVEYINFRVHSKRGASFSVQLHLTTQNIAAILA